MASVGDALPEMMLGVKRISGYFAVFVSLLLFYRFAMGQSLDESSAPIILPLIMIGMLCYDQLRKRTVQTSSSTKRSQFKMGRALTAATSETTTHIGALLLLMGLSLCVGAVVERSDIMHSVPQNFGSVWTTMGVLVVVLVIIGMTMDPYGAVILVSATLSTIATRAGIDPVHFWMVVLVAFELGYLTPPSRSITY